MSRIGKKIIEVPEGIDVNIDGSHISVKGPKGSLQKTFRSEFEIKKENGTILVTHSSINRDADALHGLTRTLISNMIEGVSKGFEKTLEINGVGYKALLQGRNLLLNLGFSHQVNYALPEGVDAVIEKQTVVTLKGIDKELIGLVASNLRSLREPEPYKGKGIKYKEERIIKKEGKTGK